MSESTAAMPDAGDDPFAALPADLQQEVVAVCDRFEAALRAGRPVRAEEFLPPTGPTAAALRSELLLTEIEYRFGSRPLAVRSVAAARLAAGVCRVAPGGDTLPAVGPYRLVRVLGSGGFGTVFLATDTRTGGEVALKVPHPRSLLDPGHRARLLQEGEAARRLDHPHVARVLDADEAGPVCYLAFEYVPGPTLGDWLAARRKAGGPVGEGEAAGLLRPVAAAVAHAHALGVLHLDLTPANVLLRDGTHPVVTDFGLARLVGEPSDVSASGVVVGTFGYLAPELAAGRRAAADARTDVYALGAILYDVLGGRPPVAAGRLPELFSRAVAGYPTWPRHLRPGVSARLEAVCLRCLEPDPGRRYPSAAAVAADLGRVLAGRPLATPAPGLATRVRWWWGRNPGRAALRLVAGFAVAGLGLVVGYHVAAISRANRELLGVNAELVSSKAEIEGHSNELHRKRYSDALHEAERMLAIHEVTAAQAALDEFRPRRGEADVRGFEWHLLNRWCTPPPHRLVSSFPRAATAVAVHPDGRMAAAGGEDGEVRLFDPTDGRLTPRSLPHPGAVESAAFSPDGRTLATACSDGLVRVWWLAGDRPPVLLAGHTKRVQSVAWAPDGRRLASGGRDGTARVWDVTAGVCRAVGTVGQSVRAVAWAADGNSVFAGGDRLSAEDSLPAACVLSPDTGQVLGRMPAHRVTVAGGFLAPNRTITAHRDGTIRVWQQVAMGQWVEGGRLATGRPKLNDLAVRPGRAEVAVCLDGGVEVWRLDPPALLSVVRSPAAGRVWTAAWTPAGTLLTAGADGAIRAWEPAADPAELAAPAVDWLAFHQADGQTRLAAGGERGVWNWRLRDRPAVESVAPDRKTAGGGFAHDGLPITVGLDGSVRRGARVVVESRVPPTLLHQNFVAVDPSGKRVALRLPDAIQVWPSGGGDPHQVSHRNSVTNLSFGPAGRLVTASSDRTLTVWTVGETGSTPVVRLSTGTDRPDLAGAGPDGWLAAGIEVATLVWGAGDTRPRFRLVGHRGRVTALAFAPDGRTLATGGEDGTVRLWHLETGREALSLPARPTAVRAIRFSPDGRYLAACDAQSVFAYDSK